MCMVYGLKAVAKTNIFAVIWPHLQYLTVFLSPLRFRVLENLKAFLGRSSVRLVA